MRTAILIATSLACDTFAQAQTGRPNTRQGFWIGFGVGGTTWASLSRRLQPRTSASTSSRPASGSLGTRCRKGVY
jgi:hypothetical protein